MIPLLVAALVAAPPVCPEPSHDRLLVQPGRDVCAASLTASGQPRAAGFLPTRCADADADYRIDQQADADRCVSRTARGRS